MKVASVNVGRPMLVVKGGRQYSTAINRSSIDGPIELSADGFRDDRVSDLRWHGGPDKAACVYPFEHYGYWQERLGKALSVPAFGENLTTLGLLEDQVCIGDTYQVGAATVQVTQPRQPCFKLANKHDEPRLIKWINELGWTGFYVRALVPGVVSKDDSIELVERAHPRITVARAMAVMLDKETPGEVLQELLDLPALSAAWRTDLEERLRGRSERLFE